MKFGQEQLKHTALSVSLFIGVYHFFSQLVQGHVIFSFLFLLASSLSGFALYTAQNKKSNSEWLLFSSICFLYLGFFSLLFSLQAPGFALSVWLGLLIICTNILLRPTYTFKVNITALVVYWGFAFLSSRSTLIHFDHALALSLLFIFVSLVTRLIDSLNNQLNILQSTDQLTGTMLPSRFMAEVKKSAQLNDRYHTPFCLICIKYKTFFKSESELDTWLIELSDIYQSRLRSMDILCRFNTQKFMILLPSTSEINASAVCNDLQKCASAYEFKFKASLHPDPHLSFSVQSYKAGEALDEWLTKIQE